MKLVVAVGGASGSVYAQRFLDSLVEVAPSHPVEVGLLFTRSGDRFCTSAEMTDPPRMAHTQCLSRVEPRGIEPLTSSMPWMRSPS